MTVPSQDRPGAIDARPVRHPGRWVAVVVIAVVTAMVVSSFVTNEKWNFAFAFEIMQQTPVIEGLWKGTVLGTVGAMALGWIVVAGIEWAAWRSEPHFGSGLPPRYYLPRVELPPPQPLEQVVQGYPDSGRDDAPTWSFWHFALFVAAASCARVP